MFFFGPCSSDTTGSFPQESFVKSLAKTMPGKTKIGSLYQSIMGDDV
jgi:hypothetical protein